MKRSFVLIGLLLSSSPLAQVLGTTRKISETQFCKKYDCQYVKLMDLEESEMWTYYISRRANFDIYREYTGKNTQASAITLRLIGSSLTTADLQLASEFLKATLNVNILPGALAACGTTKKEMVLYRSVNPRLNATCARQDSTEVQIFASIYGP